MPSVEAAEPVRFFNREYSWLDFNERVLAQVDDRRHPLLERVKFLAITASNLDEFFQVRVAALKDQVAAGVSAVSADGRTPARQLFDIQDRVKAFSAEQERLWRDVLRPELAAADVDVCRWHELDLHDQKDLAEWFEGQVFPMLTPLAVDRAHPFPYLSNLSRNLAVLVVDPDTGDERFARVKVPPRLPRIVATSSGAFMLVEDLIAAKISALFPGMDIVGCWSFRVTRSVDIEMIDDEDADDLLAAVEMEIRLRRFGRAVRLEVERQMPPAVLNLLLEELDLVGDDVSLHDEMIALSGLFELLRLDRADLKDTPLPRTVPVRFGAVDAPRDLFAAISEADVLVHHPYDSFASTVEEFVRQAAHDPNVVSIKMTLYRTSSQSEIAHMLGQAAERGVQVAVLVELKARFDEAANISWARALEQAGVHVVYGLPGLKTHAKCVLVVRHEGDLLRRYVHIGTGNYNARTAVTYEDLGLFSANPELGDDVAQLFNHLTGFSRVPDFRRIVTAPASARPRLRELIANEATFGDQGRVIVKTNAVTDPSMIEALYRASNAGVSIDVIVRGICCLVPGVPEQSMNINVRSVIGRFLEHSRVYFFANGRGPQRPLWLTGSADLMQRNLDRRVEMLVPIEQPDLVERVAAVLDASLNDTARAWRLDAGGGWTRVPTGDDPLIDAQVTCAALARPRQRWAPPTGPIVRP